MKELIEALRDDDRMAAVVIGAGIAAHAVISSGLTLSHDQVAVKAYALSEAFIAETERRIKAEAVRCAKEQKP